MAALPRRLRRQESSGGQSRQLRRLWCQQQGPGWHQPFTHIEHRAGVTVIWASTRFGLPHSQTPSDMGIPSDPSPNLDPNHEGNTYEREMLIPLGLTVWEWGCPYHYNTGAVGREGLGH